MLDQVPNVDAVRQWLSKAGGLGRQTVRPVDQAGSRDRNIFGKRSRAMHPEDLSSTTQVRVAALGFAGVGVGNERVRNYPPPWLYRSNLRPDLLDDPTKLVSQNQRGRPPRAFLPKGVQFASANAHRGDFQKNFVRLDRRSRFIRQLKQIKIAID